MSCRSSSISTPRVKYHQCGYRVLVYIQLYQPNTSAAIVVCRVQEVESNLDFTKMQSRRGTSRGIQVFAA